MGKRFRLLGQELGQGFGTEPRHVVGGRGGQHLGYKSSPGLLDELARLLSIPLSQAAKIYWLLHDVEVFIQRQGQICVTVPVSLPVW